MGVRITGVESGSPAQRLCFAAGETLERINGNSIDDVLDYRFHMTNRLLRLEGTTAAGEDYVRTLRKGEYDELGLCFETYLMSKQRGCRNHCVFCFIDQLPQGLRDSLYFKDDDSRMSFLFGNYVTLTNLTDRDVERILAMHISPINISVHTMNPALRVTMMGNPRAGEVLALLPRLAQGGIQMNAQLVLCPGVNNGPELERSLAELCALAPSVQSIAAVPVGLTKHREGLAPLRLFTQEEARAVLEAVERFGDEQQDRHGQRLCYAADEFYLSAGQPIPPPTHYGEFLQLENGVGLLALLMSEFYEALKCSQAQSVSPRRVTLATGVGAAPFLRELSKAAMRKIEGLLIEVVAIENCFFGQSITVAGLIVGGDLLTQLSGSDLGDALLLPAVMLRREGDVFLDDWTPEALSQRLGCPIITVPNDGFALLDAFLGMEPESAPEDSPHKDA